MADEVRRLRVLEHLDEVHRDAIEHAAGRTRRRGDEDFVPTA